MDTDVISRKQQSRRVDGQLAPNAFPFLPFLGGRFRLGLALPTAGGESQARLLVDFAKSLA